MTPKLKVLLAVVWSSLALDQGTKFWVIQNLCSPTAENKLCWGMAQETASAPDAGRVVVIQSWVEFVHAENKGAAWSTLADSPYRLWVFAAFTIIAVVALLQMFRTLEPDERLRAASTGLILSGALGNAIDRTWKGSVTDFIKVFAGEGDARRWCMEHFGTNVWPIWNVADACIVAGVILFGLEAFLQRDKAPSDHEEVGRDPMKAPENVQSG